MRKKAAIKKIREIIKARKTSLYSRAKGTWKSLKSYRQNLKNLKNGFGAKVKFRRSLSTLNAKPGDQSGKNRRQQAKRFLKSKKVYVVATVLLSTGLLFTLSTLPGSRRVVLKSFKTMKAWVLDNTDAVEISEPVVTEAPDKCFWDSTKTSWVIAGVTVLIVAVGVLTSSSIEFGASSEAGDTLELESTVISPQSSSNRLYSIIRGAVYLATAVPCGLNFYAQEFIGWFCEGGPFWHTYGELRKFTLWVIDENSFISKFTKHVGPVLFSCARFGPFNLGRIILYHPYFGLFPKADNSTIWSYGHESGIAKLLREGNAGDPENTPLTESLAETIFYLLHSLWDSENQDIPTFILLGKVLLLACTNIEFGNVTEIVHIYLRTIQKSANACTDCDWLDGL